MYMYMYINNLLYKLLHVCIVITIVQVSLSAMDILIMMIIEMKDKFKPFLATGQLIQCILLYTMYSACTCILYVLYVYSGTSLFQPR